MRIITPINVTGPTTFTRAGTATYTTKAGLLATAAAGELRPYYVYPEAHLLGVVLEVAGTNLVLQSEDFTNASWTKTDVTITSTTATDPKGTATAETLSATLADGSVSQAVTFTGDGDKGVSVWLKKGSATRTDITLRDATVAGNRLRANVTWAASVPSVAMTAGTLVLVEVFGDGWYRLQMTAVGVVAANTNQFRIYPAGLGTSATGTVRAWAKGGRAKAMAINRP